MTPSQHYHSMLVWGGPYHGQVVQADAAYERLELILPVERRIGAMVSRPYKETDTITKQQTVLYRVRRFAINRQAWPVLVYAENFEEHSHRLLIVMNALCRLCTWQWAL